MNENILMLVGGIGLFLLGMLVLTDGLRGLAGDSLRRILALSTRSPATGAAAGALTTAIIQSSSATTITAIGFVGAGLLSFKQALGIIFGANIGTTITGWMVAILGFKLQLGDIALPLLFVAVLLRMFARGRWQQGGWALAGFSLLFIGIAVTQDGMQAFEGLVTPESFPDDTLIGRFQLVLIGALITVVTQSSSAGVATALIALSAEAITFPQAAAMVIGMDVGTTFKAALATIGGSTASRQTGFAHVIYNLLTGMMAFALLGPYTSFVEPWVSDGATGDAQISLVAFHTIFNTLGVLLVLPFAGAFARLVIWAVPQRGPPLLRRLDERVLGDASAATDAAMGTLRAIAGDLLLALSVLLNPATRHSVDVGRLREIDDAIEVTRRFVERIKTEPKQKAVHSRHLAAMHVLDHLDRLHQRCTQRARIAALDSEPRLRRLTKILRDNVAALPDADALLAEERFDRIRALLRDQRHLFRSRTLTSASSHRIDADTALTRLDSIRWLHRAAYHVWRIVHHLRRGEALKAERRDAPEAVLDVAED